jgi:hypothetical protein
MTILLAMEHPGSQIHDDGAMARARSRERRDDENALGWRVMRMVDNLNSGA